MTPAWWRAATQRLIMREGSFKSSSISSLLVVAWFCWAAVVAVATLPLVLFALPGLGRSLYSVLRFFVD